MVRCMQLQIHPGQYFAGASTAKARQDSLEILLLLQL
jgi:hypothetical protein